MATARTPEAEMIASIDLLVFDCDGVLTPGDIIYDEDGRKLLRFSTKDGLGLALLRRFGLPLAIVSGRPTDVAEQRFSTMGFHRIAGNVRDKRETVQELAQEIGVPLENTAFVADDLPDLPAFSVVGTKIAVNDAAPEVREVASWVTEARGGQGAVREIAEGIARAKGWWSDWLDQFS